MLSSGVCQGLLVSSVLWCSPAVVFNLQYSLLVSSGHQLYLLVASDLCKSLTTSNGLCWSPLTLLVSSCLQWSLLVCAGIYHFLVVYSGIQWSLLLSAGLQLLLRVSNGCCSHWSILVCRVLQWFPVVSDSLLLSTIVSVGLYLYPVVYIGLC